MSNTDMEHEEQINEQQVEWTPRERQARSIVVGKQGVEPSNFLDIWKMGEAMSRSDFAVRRHLRGNPGACCAIIECALQWGVRTYWLANKSYVVNDQLAFESGVYRAVLNGSGRLKEVLSAEYEGEGLERVCIVRGTFKGSNKELVYRSPPFRQIEPKNSPLWKVDPDRQQFYWASRAWAKEHAEHIMGGILEVDEIEDSPIIRDVTPLAEQIKQRIAAMGDDGNGFQPDRVDADLKRAIEHAAEVGITPEKIVETIDLTADLKQSADLEQAVKEAQEAEEEPEAKPRSGVRKSARGKTQAKTKVKPTTKARVSRETPVKRTVHSAKDELERGRKEREQRETAPVKMPKNVTEYAAYAIKWMRDATDPAKLQEQWVRERKLRSDCGLISEEREPLERYKKERLEELMK